MEANRRRNWSEEETILAFYYYCKIPFGKIGKTHPDIVRIAEMLNRTPSAVALKMFNLAHFDPAMKERNVVGMSNASRMDKIVVERFFSNWEELSIEAVRIEAGLGVQSDTLPIGDTRDQTVKERINQQFFRASVLSAYGQKCCITGIDVPDLLIASHIKPWKDSDPKKERTNPSNGLCLNALHDKAFDQGLITVLPGTFTIRISSELGDSNDALGWLRRCDRQQIILPEKFIPKTEFLQYHNDVIFRP